MILMAVSDEQASKQLLAASSGGPSYWARISPVIRQPHRKSHACEELHTAVPFVHPVRTRKGECPQVAHGIEAWCKTLPYLSQVSDVQLWNTSYLEHSPVEVTCEA